jgi:hypothetical protein
MSTRCQTSDIRQILNKDVQDIRSSIRLKTQEQSRWSIGGGRATQHHHEEQQSESRLEDAKKGLVCLWGRRK